MSAWDGLWYGCVTNGKGLMVGGPMCTMVYHGLIHFDLE